MLPNVRQMLNISALTDDRKHFLNTGICQVSVFSHLLYKGVVSLLF